MISVFICFGCVMFSLYDASIPQWHWCSATEHNHAFARRRSPRANSHFSSPLKTQLQCETLHLNFKLWFISGWNDDCYLYGKNGSNIARVSMMFGRERLKCLFWIKKAEFSANVFSTTSFFISELVYRKLCHLCDKHLTGSASQFNVISPRFCGSVGPS